MLFVAREAMLLLEREIHNKYLLNEKTVKVEGGRSNAGRTVFFSLTHCPRNCFRNKNVDQTSPAFEKVSI